MSSRHHSPVLYLPMNPQDTMDSRHSSPTPYPPISPRSTVDIHDIRPHLPSLLDVLTHLAADRPAALAPMQDSRNHGPDQSVLLTLMNHQYSQSTSLQKTTTDQPFDTSVKALLKKGPWTPLEDRLLLEVIQTVLPHHPAQINWVKISRLLGSRTAKQCRERYYQNLRPGLNHGPITPDEGLLIEALVEEIGHHWAEIARRLGNRSDNAVKNWWNGRQNCMRRRERREEAQASSLLENGARRSFNESSCVGSRKSQQEPMRTTASSYWGSPSLPSPTMSDSVFESPECAYAASPRRCSYTGLFLLSTPRQPRSERPSSHDRRLIRQGRRTRSSSQTSICQLPTAPNSPAASLEAESTANSDHKAWPQQLFGPAKPQTKKMRITSLLN